MMVAHLSDTHLGRYMGEDREREEDHYDALEEAVETIIADHIKAVIHSGDLLNKPTVYGTPLKTLVTEFRRLHDRGAKIFFTLGEHDLANYPGTPNPLLLHSVLGIARYVGEGEIHRCEGLIVCGFPRHRKSAATLLEQKLSKLSETIGNDQSHRKILVLHQGFVEKHGVVGEISIHTVPTSFDYVAMGHIHSKYVDTRGDTVIACPGALHWTKVDDPDECGFYIVDLSIGEPQPSWVKLRSVRPKIVEAVDEKNVESVVSELLKKVFDKKPLLKLTVKGKEKKNLHPYELKLAEKYFLHGGGIKQETEDMPTSWFSDELKLEEEMMRLAEQVVKDKRLADFFTGEFRRLLIEGEVRPAFNSLMKLYEETR